MVWSVIEYEVEIWEWKKREKLWTLGVDWNIPRYLVRE